MNSNATDHSLAEQTGSPAVGQGGETHVPTAKSLCIDMGGYWTAINLTSSTADLVKQVTELSSTHFPESERARKWMGEIVEQARLNDGRVMAFLFSCAKTPDSLPARIPIAATSFWHHLSAPGHPVRIGSVIRSIESTAQPGDELEEIQVSKARGICRVRVGQGQCDEDSELIDILCVDYWIGAPGSDAIVHLAFSTPWVDHRAEFVDYVKHILANATWKFVDTSDEPGSTSPCQPDLSEEEFDLQFPEMACVEDDVTTCLDPIEQECLDPWWATLTTNMAQIVTLVSEWTQTQSGVLLTCSDPSHAQQ
ncbi:MAG: hypothetical protein Q3999_07080 [Buchananella hordeovulneris]|nr:hypothetical protein [Buchananella hordeovulneris]